MGAAGKDEVSADGGHSILDADRHRGDRRPDHLPRLAINWIAVRMWLAILFSFVLWAVLFFAMCVAGAWLGNSIHSINMALGR